jgi:hypothetical protein
MHGPSLAVLLVVATLGLASPTSIAGSADALAEARRKLAAEDGIAAVAILEEALPGATESKDSILSLLQQAYEAAAKQATKAGRPRDAETYRENLKILNRKPRPAARTQTAAPAPESAPSAPIPTPEIKAETPQPPLDQSTGPILLPEGPTPPAAAPPASTEPSTPPATEVLPLNDPPAQVEPSKDAPTTDPAVLPPTPSQLPVDDVLRADAAFSNKDYREAGLIYSALAQKRQLPPERREHWLYCRASEVVKQINARPSTSAEWAGINAEIDQIRAIDPKFYLGEYLRDLAAERQSGRKKTKPTSTMVVRGSAPEEPVKDQPVRQASNAAPPEASRAPAAPPSTPSPSSARIGTSVGRWQTLDTANFRIYHADPTLAGKVARAAESARLQQSKRWGSPASRATWSPLCEIYLYPSAKQYSQMTGQPEDSPGFSTMGMNAGQIISRRVNLRTDHPGLVQAVLPHEITHVILADFFTQQQIPRWADEGLAVLAEPADEQQRRAADLVGPLNANRLFAVDVLMTMDYPDNRYWSLYYAQSVSLSRYLVEQGTPAQMVQFIQTSQQEGYEPALRRVYKIDGFRDLQDRWLAYARSHAQVAATATATATGPDLKVR